MGRGLNLVLALSIGCLASSAAHSVSVRSWDASTAKTFAPGHLEGTTIDEEGRVILGPPVEELWGPEEGIVWGVEPNDSGVFVGMSSPGRLLRLIPGADHELWYLSGMDNLVTAMLADSGGGVYFGLSPDGEVLHGRGEAQVDMVTPTGAKFVWSLASAADGSIWIGTGVPGLLLRHRSGGELETVYEADDDPVRAILTLPNDAVLIGTGGRGRVIRIDESGRPFVLLDSPANEIVALAAGNDGEFYALAAKGTKQVGKAPPVQTRATETVKVTAKAPEPKPGEAAPKPKKEPPKPARFTTAPGGVLYRIDPDGGVQALWQSNGEIPFGLVRDPSGHLIVATGPKGRLYRIDERGRGSILLELASEQASAIATGPDGWTYVGATTDARVVRVGGRARRSGNYLTPAIDGGTVSDWGRLRWEADVPRGARIQVAVRAGNTDEPDDTWTDWKVLDGSGAEGVATDLISSRWLQARVEMHASRGETSPVLRRLELFFAPRNRKPVIRAVSVEPAGVVWSRAPAPAQRNAGPLVARDPVARKAAAGVRPAPAGAIRKSYERGSMTFVWVAQDPDKDKLVHQLDIRREGDESWYPLVRKIEDEFYSWDARGMPDGVYRVRLRSEDSPDNTEGKALSDRRLSPAFVIDNTRPRVERPRISIAGGSHRVEFVASDPGGNIAAVEVAVDGAPWQQLDPVDGIADSSEERYELEVPFAVVPDVARRSVMVRATDSAGNLGGGTWALDEER